MSPKQVVSKGNIIPDLKADAKRKEAIQAELDALLDTSDDKPIKQSSAYDLTPQWCKSKPKKGKYMGQTIARVGFRLEGTGPEMDYRALKLYQPATLEVVVKSCMEGHGQRLLDMLAQFRDRYSDMGDANE